MTEVEILPEIGCYGLAGHSASPSDLLDEVRLAERLGFGAAYHDALVGHGVGHYDLGTLELLTP